MPLLTPSRIAILVLSFSLITFFWTYGLPQQFGEPARPIIDHYDHKNVHTEPIIPAPVLQTSSAARHATTPSPAAHGDRPAEEDDHRWDDASKKAGEQTTALPIETGVAVHDEDGGRWEDKDKSKVAELTREPDTIATPVPSTLLTEILLAPTGANATNATIAAYTAVASADSSTPTHSVEKFCKEVHGAPHIMVILRTSKAEIDKLSTNLLGLLSCVPNFAIFSDHTGEFLGHTVYNALESIGSEAKRTHDEFREYQIMHADPEHKLDPQRTKELDKWKFLPMVYKAYHLNPSAKFFMFIEADTSLSWTNLLQWVNRLDYRIPYYSGAPTFMNSVQLAQRGSGILLSQGALRRYAKSYDELYTTKWEESVGKECCGDLILAMALNDAHVEFYSSWPLLQGEPPNTLDYTRKHWCAPAVSWHHVNGEDLTGMWDQEKKWTHTYGWEKPYLFRDAFHEFVEPYLETEKKDWDNLSQDTKIVAPQGRQQQLKEEAERSKKHQQEEIEKKKKEKEEAQRLKEQQTSQAENKETEATKQLKEEKLSEADKKKEMEEAQRLKEEKMMAAEKKKKEMEAQRLKEEQMKAAEEKKQETEVAAQKKKLKISEKESLVSPVADPDADSSVRRMKREDKKEIDWDKLAETFKDAGDSADRCQKACEQVDDCLQWRYTTNGDGECHLGKVLRLGKKTEGGEKWTSGWLVDRVQKVADEWECKEVAWRFYQ